MKLVAKVKLITTPEQFEFLKQTLIIANTVCNQISARVWETKIFGQYAIHKLVYYEIKEAFSIAAQIVVRLIAKVADAYKINKNIKRVFKLLGAITYDSRILTWRSEKQFVSIWTLGGRIKVPYACGPRQKELLKTQQGETNLVLIDGVFYLHTTCNIETPTLEDFKDIIGVDRGIVNIATLSTGTNFGAKHLLTVRCRNQKLRQKLQKKGTKSAKRLLKKRRRKENRFATHVNHVISKAIVAEAKDTNCSLALENLKGIRTRTTVRKKQRATQHSWAFYQLGQFIDYKAALAGVSVTYINPRNTSRECFACSHIDKKNRKTQSIFLCKKCGYTENADLNAARIISRRAAINPPNATYPNVGVAIPRPLAVG